MALQPQAAAGNGQVGFVKIVAALHLLVVLLALAGQDENFTGGQFGDGPLHGGGAVRQDDEAVMGFPDVTGHLPADLGRVLKAGVFGGEVNKIGVFPAEVTDIHPTLQVFVAGGAAQHLDGGAGVILLQGAEQRRKAEEIVSVIHNDGAMIAGIYQLHTSVHLDGSQRTVDGI